MSATLTVDGKSFSETVRKYAAAAGKTIADAFKMQGRLLFGEIIQRTPPQSGKAIKRMLTARGQFGWEDVADLSARKVGMRRVEMDIRKVLLPFERRAEARKGDKFASNPTAAELAEAHNRSRGARGRVRRRINALFTNEDKIKRYVAQKQHSVGQAKGGWAKAFMDLGGRMSRRGWVGRFAGKSGDVRIVDGGNWRIEITGTNRSRWANDRDAGKVIRESMAGREKAVVKDMERILKEKWGR